MEDMLISRRTVKEDLRKPKVRARQVLVSVLGAVRQRQMYVAYSCLSSFPNLGLMHDLALSRSTMGMKTRMRR
jgi:hypothetical protein